MSGVMPWEDRPPDYQASGFRLSGGNVTFTAGFAVWKESVLLFMTQKIGDGAPVLWRRFWTSHEAAVDESEEICHDAYEYLTEVLGCRERPVEDLSFEDFTEMLDKVLKNELH